VAGQQNAGYSTKLNSFDWILFYTKLGGRRLLSYMASQLRSIYDYILIDSRTGVCDTSGICTVELPDAVVVCFTLNEQSIRGAANVSESIISQRTARDELRISEKGDANHGTAGFRIYPIPTRIDTSENDKRQIGISLARKTFSRYLGDVSQADLSKYWGDFQMPYVPNYAFEEIPCVFGDLPDEALSISAFIGRLARKLTDDGAISLRALPEVRRLEALRWFQRPSETVQDPVQLAEEAFQRLSDELKRESAQVLLRLVQFTPHGISPQVLYREELQRGLSEAADALIKARILQPVPGQGGQAVQLAEPALFQIWPQFAEWIKDDLEFLQWRQSINAKARSWRLENQRESDLLRGDSLEDAKRYRRTRTNELNADEADYLAASIERDKQRRTMDELSRSNKEALELHVDRLEKELAARGSAPAKRPWSSSLIMIAVFSSAFLLATALVAAYYYQATERQMEAQKDQASEERTNAQKSLANEQQKESELRAELARMESQLEKISYLSNSSKKSSVPGSALGAKSPSSKTSGSSTAKAGGSSINESPMVSNVQPLICHIVPTTIKWTLPGRVLVRVNNLSVGSFETSSNGSTGMDFECHEDENTVEMTLSGHAPCKIGLSVKDQFSFRPALYYYNGAPSCSLEEVK